MKNYLLKFQSGTVEAVRTFEKAPGEEPTKPTKTPFVGFVGLPGGTFSKVSTPEAGHFATASPDAEELQFRFDERAGILEFDANLSREQAEMLARQAVYG